MKNAARFLCLCLLASLFAVPAQAHDHLRVSLGFGYGCCAYPYYDPYWAPPPVYYYPPPPRVVYVQPAPQPVYVEPVPVAASVAPSSLNAAQTSPTFTDGVGRTCRQFTTMMGGAPMSGTACLQEDGTWRTVAEP